MIPEFLIDPQFLRIDSGPGSVLELGTGSRGVVEGESDGREMNPDSGPAHGESRRAHKYFPLPRWTVPAWLQVGFRSGLSPWLSAY